MYSRLGKIESNRSKLAFLHFPNGFLTVLPTEQSTRIYQNDDSDVSFRILKAIFSLLEGTRGKTQLKTWTHAEAFRH